MLVEHVMGLLQKGSMFFFIIVCAFLSYYVFFYYTMCFFIIVCAFFIILCAFLLYLYSRGGERQSAFTGPKKVITECGISNNFTGQRFFLPVMA